MFSSIAKKVAQEKCSRVDQLQDDDLLMMWTSQSLRPFSIVEDAGFLKFVDYINKLKNNISALTSTQPVFCNAMPFLTSLFCLIPMEQILFSQSVLLDKLKKRFAAMNRGFLWVTLLDPYRRSMSHRRNDIEYQLSKLCLVEAVKAASLSDVEVPNTTEEVTSDSDASDDEGFSLPGFQLDTWNKTVDKNKQMENLHNRLQREVDDYLSTNLDIDRYKFISRKDKTRGDPFVWWKDHSDRYPNIA